MEKRLREARKGILPLLVLSLARSRPMSVYEIIEGLESLGVRMPIGTIYPMLKRLEREGLLKASRRLRDPRPVKEYVTTELGIELLKAIGDEIRNLCSALLRLLWGSRGSY